MTVISAFPMLLNITTIINHTRSVIPSLPCNCMWKKNTSIGIDFISSENFCFEIAHHRQIPFCIKLMLYEF